MHGTHGERARGGDGQRVWVQKPDIGDVGARGGYLPAATLALAASLDMVIVFVGRKKIGNPESAPGGEEGGRREGICT